MNEVDSSDGGATANDGHVGGPPHGLSSLPAATATAEGYIAAASAIANDPLARSADWLRATLSEVRRRRSSETTDDLADALSHLEKAVQGALARTRVDSQQAAVADTEARFPVRRQVLERLAMLPSTPTELAQAIGARPETVSRTLAALTKDGLTTKRPDRRDARRRVYELTGEGRMALNKYFAYGRPDKEAKIQDHASVVEYLRDAIQFAVALRRRSNKLEQAADQLSVVVREARKVDDRGVEFLALRELLTTLRQAERLEDRRPYIDQLELIATGRDHRFDADHVLPAYAHIEYEMGRLPEVQGGVSLSERVRHLETAATIYNRLSSSPCKFENWTTREAWSLVSLAEIDREQSRLIEALVHAGQAQQLFARTDDPYGLVRCRFMKGFCLRLRGEFDEAWTVLSEAENQAAVHGFERFRADALMQMGEVKRCQGRIADARDLLTDARGRADGLAMTVTKAFAESALGAADYADGRLDAALESLKSADRLFRRSNHGEGLALNMRRQAVVQRSMLRSGGDINRDTVTRLLWNALDRYHKLRSPAGVAACLIGSGKLALVEQADPTSHCNQLLRWIGRVANRELLELDPWVPGMLLKFAIDADHDKLQEESAVLVECAARRLKEERSPYPWARPDEANLTDGANYADAPAEAVAPRGAPEHVDEMAGEPRRIPGEMEIAA